jgi:hypothetical protein
MSVVTPDSTIQPRDQRSALRLPVRTVTATLTVADNDFNIKADATGGAIVVNLPSAAAHPGRILVIKKKDASANAVTPTRSGTDTINNAAATTFALATQDKYVSLQSDGVSAWDVIANN